MFFLPKYLDKRKFFFYFALVKVLSMRTINLVLFLLVPLQILLAADSNLEDTTKTQNKVWTLSDCISYAKENNLSVKNAELSYISSQIDLGAAKTSRLPSFSFSSNQGISNGNNYNSDGVFVTKSQYSGSYSVGGDISIFAGSRINNTIKLRKIELAYSEEMLKKAVDDIVIAVAKAYLEILYAKESLSADSAVLENSRLQKETAEAKYQVGAISSSDFAQLKAQYSTDLYSLSLSSNQYKTAVLNLKQLLELDLDETIEIYFPSEDELSVLEEVPAVADVYYSALDIMPELAASRLSVQMGEQNIKIAKSSLYPSISLNASVGTNHYYKFSGNDAQNIAFLSQIKNNLTENLSLGIRVPIYQKGEVRANIKRAELSSSINQLNLKTAEKNLLKTIEALHQDALAAQERYAAAQEKLQYNLEALNLVQEQYLSGKKSFVEVSVVKTNYLSAVQERLKSKYQAVLSLQLLSFYKDRVVDAFSF